MMTLVMERTEAPQTGQKPLSADEAEQLAREVPQWKLENGKLTRHFSFDDFEDAMEFVNEVARVALQANHHPDIFISYNKVRLELSTHKIGGLSRNDFIVAARINEV